MKQRRGNAELNDKETALGTDLNLGSKGNVSLDSNIKKGENSSRKDAHLETQQFTYLPKTRKKNGNSLIDEKQSELLVESKVNVSLESGLKEEANSIVNDTLLERDSRIDTLESFGSESGLNEQAAYSGRNKKKKKKRKKDKMANGGRFEEEGPDSVVELRAGKENSVIDGRQSDCHVESKVSVNLELGETVGLESGLKGSESNEQLDDLERERKKTRKRECKMNVSLDSGQKEGANSQKETVENIILESGLKGVQLSEQMIQPERKRKRKRKRGKRTSVLQDYDPSSKSIYKDEENCLIDEKKIDIHVESKMNVSLDSGQKEGANSEKETVENIILESGLKDIQLSEQIIQPERKRKRKKRKRGKRTSVLQDYDLSSKRIYGNDEEAENDDACLKHQTTNSKDFRKEDFIPESVELKSVRKHSVIPDKQMDLPQNASNSMVKTQELDADVNFVVSDVKDNKSFQTLKVLKTYQRKRKRSSDNLGGSLEPVRDNCLIKASIDRLGKEHTTGFSESRPDGVPVGEHAMPEQVREEAFGNNEGSNAAFKHRKGRKKLKESLCKDPDQKDVETKTNMEELIPSPLNSAVAKDDATLEDTVKEKKTSLILHSSLERICTNVPKKKLLVLDLNGILVDVVPNPGEFRPHIKLSGKGVFKRPFCNDFLEFCLRTFNVGIWSSRINKNVRILVDFLMKKRKKSLLFCWDRSRCTITKLETIEDKPKPLVLKELRKLWKNVSKLPWEKGEYDESNTLLLDDSPYKALRNPANTAIFPFPYQYTDAEDASLGPGGDIRTYLEGVAAAENVQKYVEQNPFGQPAITESNPHWDFYRQIIDRKR